MSGYTDKHVKSMRRIIQSFDKAHPEIAEQIRRAENIRQFKDQTIMFWNLQLQFMELDGLSVEELYKSIRQSPLYIKNEFTRKLDKMIDKRDDFSEDDRLCIITHVALQLSGLA